MPQVIQLSRPGTGPLLVSIAAIAVISPGSFGESWQGIHARVQLLDGRWYRVSQRPEEIMRLIADSRETQAANPPGPPISVPDRGGVTTPWLVVPL